MELVQGIKVIVYKSAFFIELLRFQSGGFGKFY